MAPKVICLTCPFCGQVGEYDRQNPPDDGDRCPCGAEVSFLIDRYVEAGKRDVERRVRESFMHDENDLEGLDARVRVEFEVVPAVYTVKTGDDDYVETLVIDALFGRHVR